ncbi:MAG: arginine--tRNA ligase [Proteobacteria bacterium]|nr:arginine--tRNA ligase [Cystobacterineae bacterium]MCL2258694.1 arginine--tRNA ligase [Cystobacterineae bacterium]MCL2313896.1 arginine--tRNA ligase [Pseudomonadota bacterium]
MTTPVLQNYRQKFAKALSLALPSPLAEVEKFLKPAEEVHGDFTLPMFAWAKQAKKNPAQLASEIAPQLAVEGMEVKALGPYVNARLLPMPFGAEVLLSTRQQGAHYGSGTSGAGKTVVIDFSSPNIAKPIAFHHIRSTVIGNALANLHRSQGWKVVGINYLGDWGKQFGLVAAGFALFGDNTQKHNMRHLVDVYVKANAKAEEEPAFDDKARAFFARMEAGEAEALALWREFREASLVDFKALYARLGIHFDAYEGESFYQGKMDKVIEDISNSLGTRVSQGALIANLPYADGEPPVLLKKNDGSTLYATRDLAAAVDRFERFGFDKSLYVVAADQSLHFRQVFSVLEKMGKPWAHHLSHVAFGRVHGMSTRKGQLHLLSEVLDEAQSRALEKVRENISQGKIHTHTPEALAEQIGLGAIVFGDLKNRRTTDYVFDWEEVLSFEGHTGVYVQYAYARASAILQKAATTPSAPFEDTCAGELGLPEEQSLLRWVAKLPELIQEAVEQNEPSFVARWLLDGAAAFSRWYTLGNQDRSKRVLLEDNPRLRSARLALVEATRTALGSGLGLLGVAAPQNM